MPTAYINIGSNRGDRAALIARAVALIALRLGVKPITSSPVESPPWGYDSPHPFLNVGAAFPTTLPPDILLDRLLAIEHEISPLSHRNPDDTYADRLIDIDLIAVDNLIVPADAPTPAGNRLTLPHPLMHLRPFVLIPMAEIAPDWCHPIITLTPAEMLHTIQ